MLSLFPSNHQREFSWGSIWFKCFVTFYIMFSLSIYSLTYPFTYLYFHLSTQVKKQLESTDQWKGWSAEGKDTIKSPGAPSISVLFVVFLPVLLIYLFVFGKCSICILSREYHLSLLIMTQMIRKYLVMFAVSLIVPLDIHSMLWSQKM